jgi:hypothetical protein
VTRVESRFALLTLVSAVTAGLFMTILEGPTTSVDHFLLKFGYALPSLLLNVDMWAQYNRYYEQRETYKHRELFLDVLILALSYIGLSTLKATPVGSGAEAFREYPPRLCWIALILYSLIKTYRAWPVYGPDVRARFRISWMSLLHVVLLLLIVSAWAWQQGVPRPVPLPFAWSGVVFTALASLYLFAVYVIRWDPLTPLGLFRKWSE